jgi:hypothetical protein
MCHELGLNILLLSLSHCLLFFLLGYKCTRGVVQRGVPPSSSIISCEGTQRVSYLQSMQYHPLSLTPLPLLLGDLHHPLLLLTPLLMPSSSSEVVASHNNQGGQTSSSLPLLPLLLVSSLDTLLLTSHLFTNLSSFVLLSSTILSPTLPPGVVSFLFILGLTPHLTPLAIFFLLLCFSFLLSSTLLVYLSLFLSSAPLGPFFPSPHLNIFWILLVDPSPLSLFPLLFIPPPPALGESTQPSYRLHVHQPFLHEQHLDPQQDFF